MSAAPASGSVSATVAGLPERREHARSEELPVAESLLVPFLDAAAAVMVKLDPAELPPVLRPLAGFDRRGLQSGPARLQLRRALEVDERFRAQVVERFLDKAEVAAALEEWNAAATMRRIEEAADRSDLPWLASALYAAHPDGWEFGLGAITAIHERTRTDREREDDAKARDMQLRSAEDARRRSDESRDKATTELAQFNDALRDERRARRDRELQAERATKQMQRRHEELDAELTSIRAQLETVEAKLAREAERARNAEQRVRVLQRELKAQARAMPPAVNPGIESGIQSGVEVLPVAVKPASPQPATPRSATPEPAVQPKSTSSTTRTRAACPPGMRSDSPEALDAMLRTRGVVLVIDGYNVTMSAWGDAELADQRERLLGALERVHLRLRCDVVVVFDGADVEATPPHRRSGVRVVFSAPGEGADPVVVREVAGLSPKLPAVVVSTDQWVREQSERLGATGVPAATLIELLRR